MKLIRKASIYITFVSLWLAGSAYADYQIDWVSLNSGGGVASGTSYTVNCSIGQGAAGYVQNVDVLHWAGFWTGEPQSVAQVINPGDAKLLRDGKNVSIAGMIVTSDSGDFSEFFYIEDENRSSGIRIAVAPSSILALTRDKLVQVTGTMGTTDVGERQIIAAQVLVGSVVGPIEPVGMNNKWVGGGSFGDLAFSSGQVGVTGGTGLNNIGLLVSTWGSVKDNSTSHIVIDDGSGVPIYVDATTLVNIPDVGSYVCVTGISSLRQVGRYRHRLILPRNAADWREF